MHLCTIDLRYTLLIIYFVIFCGLKGSGEGIRHYLPTLSFTKAKAYKVLGSLLEVNPEYVYW